MSMLIDDPSYSPIRQTEPTKHTKDKGINPYKDLFVDTRQNEEVSQLDSSISCFVNSLFCLFFPCCCYCSIKKVTPMHDSIVMQCGQVTQVLRQPGLYCIPPCGMDTIDVYMGVNTTEISKIGAADVHGNPIVISAQYSYRVTNSIDAHYKTYNRHSFIKEQAESALRAVVAKYPYDIDHNNGDKNFTDSLTKQSDKIDALLVETLQVMVDFVGVNIESFRLINVSFDPKMEKLLLARQEAQAEVNARTAIAEGTTGIIKETLSRLKVMGIHLTPEETNKFATNLTMILVNHGHTSLNIFDNSGRKGV
jgi:SPFH domain/Band 7 family protein